MLYARMSAMEADDNSMTRQSLHLLTRNERHKDIEVLVGRQGGVVTVLGAIFKDERKDAVQRLMKQQLHVEVRPQEMPKAHLASVIRNNNTRRTFREVRPIQLSETQPGEFMGNAHNYNILNTNDTIIRPGSFTKSLRERKDFPLLFEHFEDVVLGIVKPVDSSSRLLVKGKLDLTKEGETILNPDAWRVYSLWRQGETHRQMSVCGRAIKYQYINDEEHGLIEDITEMSLMEISICAYGANPGTSVEMRSRETTSEKKPADTPNTGSHQKAKKDLLSSFEEMAKW